MADVIRNKPFSIALYLVVFFALYIALAKNLVVSYSLIGPDVDTESLGMGDVELKTVPLPKNEITRYGLSEGANANR